MGVEDGDVEFAEAPLPDGGEGLVVDVVDLEELAGGGVSGGSSELSF